MRFFQVQRDTLCVGLNPGTLATPRSLFVAVAVVNTATWNENGLRGALQRQRHVLNVAHSSVQATGFTRRSSISSTHRSTAETSRQGKSK